MTAAERLSAEFCDSLNADLAREGCRCRVTASPDAGGGRVLLVDAAGHELGWLPDHVDAPMLRAFEQILGRESGGSPAR